MLGDMSYMSFVDYLTAESDLRERQRKERMKQAAFEKYAKEHNLFVCSTDVIEQMKKEILEYFLWDGQDVDSLPLYVRRVLNIIDKYQYAGMSKEEFEHFEKLAEHYNKKVR